ncbi:MAG: hypothetical protein QOD63_622 [Actinomycetota bacterium]|nr:hypothetical protein [Actinomycetota bacterium]
MGQRDELVAGAGSVDDLVVRPQSGGAAAVSPEDNEAIRSSLYGLALLWLDRPELEREVLVAAMLRVVRGILLGACDPGS